MKTIKPLRCIMYFFMITYLIICVYPLIWMGFYSLKNNEEIFVTNPFGPPIIPQWSNYVKALTQFNIPLFFYNSIIISIGALLIGLTAVLLFTYVVARIRTRITNLLKLMVMAGLFVPVQAIMIPLIIMVSNLNLVNTHWSLIIPYAVMGFPFSVMVLYGFYISLPIELEESAYMEGAGFVRTYVSIILPQLKSIIAVLVIYCFMQYWNEFSLALILITKADMKTLPVGLAGFWGAFSSEWGPIGASLVIASVPVIVTYLFFSNKISDSIALSGMKN